MTGGGQHPRVRALVMAKAPVPGRCKTRLGAEIGMAPAARIAAAALADTLRACADAFGADRCVLALDGTLGSTEAGAALAGELAGWTVVPQRGADLGERLAAAHRDAGPGPVLQVGMDTPQADVDALRAVAGLLDAHPAVLGPAEDGGWWVLALRDPADAAALRGVPMSAPDTGVRTREALEGRGLAVASAARLRDVDTAADAEAVAAAAPDTEFARTWALLRGGRS